jgi:hypothetical protein
LITAPLHTLHVSLQLSVLSHQNKYGDVQDVEDRKAIAKIGRELTVQDRRKFELLVKSGVTGTNKPFRAPVYTGYSEAFKALLNQGALAFYKGNFLGLIAMSVNTLLKNFMMVSPNLQRTTEYYKKFGVAGTILACKYKDSEES